MLAALQATHGALQVEGIHLSPHKPLPEEVEPLLHEALCEAWKSPVTRSLGIQRSTPTEPVELHARGIESLQRSIDTSKSPFARIAPEHRWRMCLDPLLVDLMEKHVGGARDNPLLPFALDSESGYLHGVLNGWNTSMKGVNERLDAKFIAKLHQACCPRDAPDKKELLMNGFDLHLGENMTQAGLQELREFGAEMQKSMPGFAVTSSREKFAEFNERLAAAKPGEQVLADEPQGDRAVSAHPEVPFSTLLKHMDRFVTQYHHDIRHSKNDEQRLAHIVDLCQKLERLHPFPDGNCRTFGILLLNNLLVRNGLPLTMLNDPNILDGWSRQEVIDEVKSGWARVAQYSMNGPQHEASAKPKQRWNDSMKNRLDNLFTASKSS